MSEQAVETLRLVVQVEFVRKRGRRSSGAIPLPSVQIFACDWEEMGGPIPYPIPDGTDAQGQPQFKVGWARDLDHLEERVKSMVLKLESKVDDPEPPGPAAVPAAPPRRERRKANGNGSGAEPVDELLDARKRASPIPPDPLDGLAPPAATTVEAP